jgi:hypothetical protein
VPADVEEGAAVVEAVLETGEVVIDAVDGAEPERSYRAPCVVLVINDNPYGLMVALSYMCRTCP